MYLDARKVLLSKEFENKVAALMSHNVRSVSNAMKLILRKSYSH